MTNALHRAQRVGVKYLPMKDPDGLQIEFFEGRAVYESSISHDVRA